MSYEIIPADETGEAVSTPLTQAEIAQKIFDYNHNVLDFHAILEHVIVATPDLPPGKNTCARVYRVRHGENATLMEWGGVCLFPTDEPFSPHRVNVEVYRVESPTPIAAMNDFTWEQVDVVIRLLDCMDRARELGGLVDLSPDYTHIVPETYADTGIAVPDISFFMGPREQ